MKNLPMYKIFVFFNNLIKNVIITLLDIENELNMDINIDENSRVSVKSSVIVSDDHITNQKTTLAVPPVKKSNNKYLIKCPSTLPSIYFQAPLSIASNVFKNNYQISNGNIKFPPKLKGKQYFFDNTAWFDSVFEIFLYSYNVFYKDFKDFCDCNINNKFLLAVSVFNTTKINKYYKSRLIILLEVAEVHGDTIKSEQNLGYYFKKLMGQNYSLSQIIFCRKCQNRKESNHSYIMSYENLKPVMLQSQNFVRDLLSYNDNKYICVCGNLMEIEYNFHSYIAIDLENQGIKINLYGIKDLIVLGDKKFILTGAIEVKTSDEGNKNYNPYFRSLQGFWVKKCDKKKSFKHLKTNLLVNLAFLIYIKE